MADNGIYIHMYLCCFNGRFKCETDIPALFKEYVYYPFTNYLCLFFSGTIYDLFVGSL